MITATPALRHSDAAMLRTPPQATSTQTPANTPSPEPAGNNPRTHEPGADEPRTIAWEGEPRRADWGAALLAGSMTGGLAFLGTAFLTDSARGPRLGLALGLGAAGLTLGTLGAAAIGNRLEREPAPLPDPAAVPTLPRAAEVPGAPGWAGPAEPVVGRVSGSWSTTSFDSDGNLQTDYHSMSARLTVQEHYGRFDGYDSVDDALADAPGAVPVAAIEHDGRTHLFRIRRFSDSSEIDRMTGEPGVAAVVVPNGRIWRRDAEGSLRRAGSVGRRPEVDASRPGQIGRFHVEKGRDSHVVLEGRRSPATGYATAAEALGDAQARAGDQAVVEHDGRFHVFNSNARIPGSHVTVHGLRTTQHSDRVVAVEVQGEPYVAAGSYWMTPRAGG